MILGLAWVCLPPPKLRRDNAKYDTGRAVEFLPSCQSTNELSHNPLYTLALACYFKKHTRPNDTIHVFVVFQHSSKLLCRCVFSLNRTEGNDALPGHLLVLLRRGVASDETPRRGTEHEDPHRCQELDLVSWKTAAV